jgi:hypothetical protein
MAHAAIAQGEHGVDDDGSVDVVAHRPEEARRVEVEAALGRGARGRRHGVGQRDFAAF